MILFFLACASETTFSGTFVGNPGKGNARMPSSEGVTLSKATTNVHYVYYFSSIGDRADEVNQEVDLLSGEGEFKLLAGAWETVIIETAPGLTLEGNALDTQDFTWELPEFFIELKFPEGGISEQQYILEVGAENWLSADAIVDLGNGSSNLEIAEIEEFSGNLEDLLAQQSQLFLDSDGDGMISEQEREYSIATGNDLEEEEEPEDWDLLYPGWLIP